MDPAKRHFVSSPGVRGHRGVGGGVTAVYGGVAFFKKTVYSGLLPNALFGSCVKMKRIIFEKGVWQEPNADF